MRAKRLYEIELAAERLAVELSRLSKTPTTIALIEEAVATAAAAHHARLALVDRFQISVAVTEGQWAAVAKRRRAGLVNP